MDLLIINLILASTFCFVLRLFSNSPPPPPSPFHYPSHMNGFLSKDMFMQMLSHEENIMNGKYERLVIEDLINLYAQCVEYYDSHRDPIQFYFLEKMQILLSQEKIVKEMIIFENKRARKQSASSAKSESIIGISEYPNDDAYNGDFNAQDMDADNSPSAEDEGTLSMQEMKRKYRDCQKN